MNSIIVNVREVAATEGDKFIVNVYTHGVCCKTLLLEITKL